ncbi:cytochrome P450 [Lophiostoma macrostomum CBS 122681]|uniref:Cytochrome P450 n=1 Tax=Lophiostoma macrostomum CBS 122681 TaxID=1314788 RepID=A0A6A6SIV4_9PLEO|nr:cytochrome P450 [Lophiostoma macrostomum CBS 122681]
MERYFTSQGHHTSSQLVLARHRILKPVLSLQDRARAEVTNGLAILANTAPAAFWVVWHVFEDRDVLDRVRQEVGRIVVVERGVGDGYGGQNSHEREGGRRNDGEGEEHREDENGDKEIRTIKLAKLKHIPLLFSLIQETLRYRACGTGPRFALEDVTLSDGFSSSYTIEKGAMLILAHEGMHHDKRVWGDDADAFVADRFVPGNKIKIPGNAFRGFGGGANMCPGKSFALHEIAALVAMLVMRVDFVPVEGSGGWSEPGMDEGNMAREHTAPKRRVLVRVVPRREVEGVVWRVG